MIPANIFDIYDSSLYSISISQIPEIMLYRVTICKCKQVGGDARFGGQAQQYMFPAGRRSPVPILVVWFDIFLVTRRGTMPVLHLMLERPAQHRSY